MPDPRGARRPKGAGGLTGALVVLVTACAGGGSAAPGPESPGSTAGSGTVGGTTTVTEGTAGGAGLPGSLTGIMPEAHGHLGPHRDGNGRLYTVVEDLPGSTGNEPKAMRSSDGGATWIEIDRGGRPTAGDLEGDWTAQAGSQVWFGYQKSNGSVFLAAFRTSDAPSRPETWSVVDEKVHDTAVEPDDQWVGLSALRNGDLWVLYATDPTSSHPYRIGVRKRSAATGSLSAEVILDPGRDVSQAVAVTGPRDLTHVFYKDHRAQQVLHRTLAPDGTLGPPVRIDEGGVHPVFAPLTNPVVHAGAVTVAWADPAGVLRSTTMVGGRRPAASETLSDVPVLVDPAGTTNRGTVAHLVADGPEVHAVHADAVTQDVRYDVRPAGGGWGTDVEIADAVQTLWLTGLVVLPDRVGGPVLGYLYDTGPHGDDSGMIRYDEHRP